MADYCTLAEAKAFLPMVTISATGTEPTETQVTSYISYVTSEVNAILVGRGYSLSQTDDDALAYLKTVCLNGVASLVLRAKHPTIPDIDASYRQAFRDALADIREGRVLVPDGSTESSSIGEGFTYESDDDNQYGAGDTAAAPFVRRDVEW